jgi:hypothetical protein
MKKLRPSLSFTAAKIKETRENRRRRFLCGSLRRRTAPCAECGQPTYAKRSLADAAGYAWQGDDTERNNRKIYYRESRSGGQQLFNINPHTRKGNWSRVMLFQDDLFFFYLIVVCESIYKFYVTYTVKRLESKGRM